MATYTKFEENSIRKQEQSYKNSFAKKNFAWSCEQCCAKNLRGGRGTCATCPIKEAHVRALSEIQAGVRGKPETEPANYGATKHSYNGRVTIVINFN